MWLHTHTHTHTQQKKKKTAPDSWKPKLVPLPLSSSPLPFIIEPPNLVLKPLSNTLKYVFLGSLETLPIIIASELDDFWQHQLIKCTSSA